VRPCADAAPPLTAAGRISTPNSTRFPGVSCLLAQGAFYLFPNISSFGLKDIEFCNRLLDAEKVAAVPGSAFGAEGYLRLSYATSDEIIAKGVERLGRFCASLKK
jgi:aspartate aminotransferase